MKIHPHPQIENIAIGDEVYSYPHQLLARVDEVFPAAVCVRIGVLANEHRCLELISAPQLWRADEIENLSVCRYCASRENLQPDTEESVGIPRRICTSCATGPTHRTNGYHHPPTQNGSDHSTAAAGE